MLLSGGGYTGPRLPGETTRGGCGLRLFALKRALLNGWRSLGTIRPPAVTRRPGGLPCSLSSLSAFPRLMDGEGDGFFAAAVVPAAAGAAKGREELSTRVPIRQADADGLKTCSLRCITLVGVKQLKKQRGRVWCCTVLYNSGERMRKEEGRRVRV